MTHPTQPTYEDKQGIIRFKKNAIVNFLLEKGGFDMNALARMDFSDEDRRQFAQLIGYSVDGYNDLTYAEEVKEKDFYTVSLLFQRRKGNDTINTVKSFMCEGENCEDGFAAKAAAERHFAKTEPKFFSDNSIVAWDVQSWVEE